MALTTWAAYQAAHPDKAQQLTQILMCIKGTGVNENYVMEVDPATGTIPVSATVTPGPLLFTLNGADQKVTEDTVAHANDRPLPVKVTGVTMANPPVRNDYTGSAVTTGAYVQLVASLTATCQKLCIFDSSGQTMILAVGAAGAENPIFYIPPGGIDMTVMINSGSRIAIKALSANATVGEIVMNITT